MSEEIKQLIDYLQKFVNDDRKEITKYGLEISQDNTKLLLNYIEQLQQKNKELKNTNASLQSALSLSRQKYNNDKQRYRRKYKKEHNILTEFEKWLEELLKSMESIPADDMHQQLQKDCMLSVVDSILDKLQELREGKK